MINNFLVAVEVLRLNRNLQKMDKIAGEKHNELKLEKERYQNLHSFVQSHNFGSTPFEA